MKFSDFLSEETKKQLNEWFAGKEELRFFEDLARQQHRLYNDAADVGYTIKSDQEKESARRNLMELMRLHGYKMNRWGNGGTTTSLFIPIEQDERHTVAGIALVVSFWKDKTMLSRTIPVEILSVEMDHKTLEKTQAVSQFGFKHPEIFEGVNEVVGAGKYSASKEAGNLTELSKPLASFITAYVEGEIGYDFPGAKVRITRNTIKQEGPNQVLQIHADVSIPFKVELSDLDVTWDRVKEIIQKNVESSTVFMRFAQGLSLNITNLKRGPRGALFGIEITR